MSKVSLAGKALAVIGMLASTTVTAALPATATNSIPPSPAASTSSGYPAVDGKWADTGPFEVAESTAAKGRVLRFRLR